MLVTICVSTYQRPAGLKRLMEGLNNLTFRYGENPQIKVIVVDNDPSALACGFCQDLHSNFQWDLSCYLELKRGVSYSRNSAVANADPNTDFFAFIDDDEVPQNNWLEELLRVQDLYDADIVYGRVVPYFENDAPDWVIKGKFFEQSRQPTGASLEAAYTNNVLIKASLLKERDQVFDERFALTGGEDSYLFRTLHHHGHSIIWANDAIVYDWIPDSRMTMQWILMRAYRSCLTYTTWELEVKASGITKVIPMLKAITQIFLGVLLVLPSVVFSKHIFVKSLMSLYKGAGCLSAFFGLKYEEYKTVHGS